ncbi:hypothetical protein [Streptomyces sp. NPDC059828]|uniref:hypothetical protein n=1 Tax=Streptomyces sp. NPDC059828 TaxID=3346965 RepID=UPI00364D3362
MTSGWERALAGASSRSWSERVRAGHDLASFAEAPEASAALVELLLDRENTAVTRRTAEALVRVGTVVAIRLVALAVAGADDDQADWMQTGVHDALAGTDGAPDVAALCRQLARDPEAAVRRGASEISAWAEDAGG